MTRALRLIRLAAMSAWLFCLVATVSAQAPPTLYIQPFNQSACVGGDATFSVAAAGSQPLAFQWRRDGLDIFSGVVSSLTNSTLTLNGVLPPDAASVFDVIVSNVGGAATSATAQVFFNDPAIFLQPQGVTVNAGGFLSLNLNPCGTGPLFYQWYFNDAPLVNGGRISGANGPALGINNAIEADSGAYRAVVHNTHGAIQSQVASCRVVSPPAIVSPPQSAATCPGADAVFQLTASGTPPLYFEWHRDGTNVEAHVISTATNSVLTLTNVQFPDALSVFDVTISNDFGTVTSDLVNLLFPSTAIRQSPANTVVAPGGVIQLSADGCGLLPLSYQWFRGAVALTNDLRIAGANSNLLSIAAAVTGDTGDYKLVVTDGPGLNSAASAVARCFVGIQPTVGGMTSRVVRLLAGTTFNPTYTGTLPRSYQWYRNDVAIPGANTPTLNRTSVQRPHVGRYHVVVSNGAGSVTSEKAHLQVRLGLEGTSVVPYEEATDELPSLTNAVKSFFTPPATTLFHGVPLLFTTYGATAQPWETECCGVPPGHTMWVRYHARLAEPTRVTTEGSTFNTVLGVYTWNKSPDAAPVLVGCNDNGGYDGQTSRLFFNPAPLTDYYIMVDGVGGAQGIVRLQVGEPIRNAVHNPTNDSFRFEYSGFFVSNNVLRTAGSLALPVTWSNLATVAPTNMDWVRGYTNIPASASPQRFYHLRTTP